jgi:hypothetical protein
MFQLCRANGWATPYGWGGETRNQRRRQRASLQLQRQWPLTTPPLLQSKSPNSYLYIIIRAGFMLIFIWILSVQGGINQIFQTNNLMLKIIPADRLTGELHTKTEIRNGTRFQLKFIPSNNSFIFFKWFEFWRIYFLSFIISIDIHYRKNAD